MVFLLSATIYFTAHFVHLPRVSPEGVGRGQGLFTNIHKSLATCAISHPIGPLCACASVYSNFNIVHTQLCIKTDYTKYVHAMIIWFNLLAG